MKKITTNKRWKQQKYRKKNTKQEKKISGGENKTKENQQPKRHFMNSLSNISCVREWAHVDVVPVRTWIPPELNCPEANYIELVFILLMFGTIKSVNQIMVKRWTIINNKHYFPHKWSLSGFVFAYVCWFVWLFVCLLSNVYWTQS